MDMTSPMDSLPPSPDHVKSKEEFVPSRQELYLQFLEERDFAYYRKVLCDMQKDIKAVKDSGILQKAIEDLEKLLQEGKTGDCDGEGSGSAGGMRSEREKDKDGSDVDLPDPKRQIQMDMPPLPPDHVKSMEEFVPSRQELYLQFLEERDFAYYRKVLCDMQKDIKDVKDSGVLHKGSEDLEKLLQERKTGDGSGSSGGKRLEREKDKDGSDDVDLPDPKKTLSAAPGVKAV